MHLLMFFPIIQDFSWCLLRTSSLQRLLVLIHCYRTYVCICEVPVRISFKAQAIFASSAIVQKFIFLLYVWKQKRCVPAFFYFSKFLNSNLAAFHYSIEPSTHNLLKAKKTCTWVDVHTQKLIVILPYFLTAKMKRSGTRSTFLIVLRASTTQKLNVQCRAAPYSLSHFAWRSKFRRSAFIHICTYLP